MAWAKKNRRGPAVFKNLLRLYLLTRESLYRRRRLRTKSKQNRISRKTWLECSTAPNMARFGGRVRARSKRPWGTLFTSRGRGSGFAGPQAQRPLGGQRITRSEKRGALYLAADLALPARRRSGPLGGQGATRSERPWRLCLNAATAATSFWRAPAAFHPEPPPWTGHLRDRPAVRTCRPAACPRPACARRLARSLQS